MTVGRLGGTLAADEPFVRWDWVGDHTDEIVGALWQHVQLTVVAVAIGFVLALAMALVVTRWRWTFRPPGRVRRVVYAIPSLALFGVLVAIPAFGLGFRTAEVALVGYTLLILLRNIVAGLDGVPAATREAADGMGFERWRRLTAVDLPLANARHHRPGSASPRSPPWAWSPWPAWSSRPEFGRLIADGLGRNSPTSSSAVGSVLLAVAFDLAFVVAERLLTPWARVRVRQP